MKYSLQQKRNSPYYFCVFHTVMDGRRKQVWKSTKCRNIDDAHERSKDILAEFNTGYSRKELDNVIDDILNAAPSLEEQQQRDEKYKKLLDRRDAERKKEQLHFDYIIDEYVPNVFAKTKSNNFCKAIKLAVRKLKKYSGVDNVYDLDRKVLNDFKLKLLENGQKTNSVILIMNCVSGLLKSLYENNYLDTLTRINSGLKKIENDKVHTLEDDEFETILEHAYKHDYNMYLIFCNHLASWLHIMWYLCKV